MTEWEPATGAEADMRDALRANDQELYFQILARTELLLPVSVHALTGHAPMGWGTWTTGGRTHVLAFTSPAALKACLAENECASRRMAYHGLASTWPNHEWWLAVNPGLPIEGYLPAWFVAQLARGDVRLPGRKPSGRSPQEQLEMAARGRGMAEDYAASPPAAVSTGVSGALASPTAEHVTAGWTATAPNAAGGEWVAGGRRPVRGESGGGERLGGAGYGRPGHGAVISGQIVPGPGTVGRRDDPPAPDGPSAVSESPAHPDPSSRAVLSSETETQDLAQPVGPGGQAIPAGRVEPDQSGEPGAVPPASPVATQAVPVIPGASAGPPPIPDDPAAGSTGNSGETEKSDLTSPLASSAPDGSGASEGGDQPATAQPEPAGSRQPGMDESADTDRPVHQEAARRPPDPAPSPTMFEPANDVERSLLEAAGDGSTETFLSTLLLAKVLLPVDALSAPGTRPGDEGFRWGTESIDGVPHIVVFTSVERLAEHRPGVVVETVGVKFVQLIRRWPKNDWSFAVNPGTPVGAKLPGAQIVALASWADEVGLGSEPEPTEPAAEPVPRSSYAPVREDPGRPTMMQKAIAPSQVSYYLDRGYDRVSGFVHRAGEISHLGTPAQLAAALGLVHPGSPFSQDAEEIFVLRWPAYRPSLYRIPYGGQNEAAMRAMEGWVIERAPFRGNGFAPGEGTDVIAEFKVDSVRLPHGAQLYRIGADGTEVLIAVLDSDALTWRRIGGPDA